MSKIFLGDWKGKAVAAGEGETHVIPRMITSQASAVPPSLSLTRPALSLQPPGQPAFILQPHHEMKNYGVRKAYLYQKKYLLKKKCQLSIQCIHATCQLDKSFAGMV